MRIGTVRELHDAERRVAVTPASTSMIRKLGHEVAIQSGAGAGAGFSDEEYTRAGAEVIGSAADLWQQCDAIAKIRPPTLGEVEQTRADQLLISFIFPAQNDLLLGLLAEAGVTAIALDMVPRISRAQKLDALSSMANIAGYRAVIEASGEFGRFFAGQITAAGTVNPARVLVIGAGVAGLSAIGTAVSLGAVVHAFDVRPEVAEQISSMGAEFLFLEFEEDASGSGGYAKPSSPEFRRKQLDLFRQQAPKTDILITTALIPGMKAPELWLEEMVSAMKPGSVIVDLAAEQGGNCSLTIPDRLVTTDNGVKIIGYTDFPSRMATQSSLLLANNVHQLLGELTPERDGQFRLDFEDDIIRCSTVARQGEVTYPQEPPRTAPMAVPKSTTKREPSKAELREQDRQFHRRQTQQQVMLLATGGALVFLIGLVAPASFMQHFIVFILSCFVGYQVIWNVSHALHTPLMSVTNAISGIIIVGALLQIPSANTLVIGLAAISVLIATINIVGGFLVTRRMLAMFQKS